MTEETWEGEGGRILTPDELDELISDGEPVSPVRGVPLSLDPETPQPLPFKVTVTLRNGRSFNGEGPGSAFYMPVGIFVHGSWTQYVVSDDDPELEDHLFPFSAILSIQYHADEFREGLENES